MRIPALAALFGGATFIALSPIWVQSTGSCASAHLLQAHTSSRWSYWPLAKAEQAELNGI
jgi:hypothetical protein